MPSHSTLPNSFPKRLLLLIAISLLLMGMGSYASAQTLTTLYNFGYGKAGILPYSGVVFDGSGDLVGTTTYVGWDAGAIYVLTPGGSVKTAYVLGHGNGVTPRAGLIMDRHGNFFGTAESGGGKGKQGTVFELTNKGTLKVLHRFTGSDGSAPITRLVEDHQGNLYGTTQAGGNYGPCIDGCGVIFKLSRNGTYTVLHSFTNGADGAIPSSGLLRDAAGNLYGTTLGYVQGNGFGNVFQLTPAGSLNVLYSFTGGADGSEPSGDLIQDEAGNLYGTTWYGGSFVDSCSPVGCGVVFRLTLSGQLTVLHTFGGTSDGSHPSGGLVRDAQGDLYGTANLGGPNGGGVGGDGTIFKVTPAGDFTLLYAFAGTDGANPNGDLIFDGAGKLYGTCSTGGAYDAGTVFKLTP